MSCDDRPTYATNEAKKNDRFYFIFSSFIIFLSRFGSLQSMRESFVWLL